MNRNLYLALIIVLCFCFSLINLNKLRNGSAERNAEAVVDKAIKEEAANEIVFRENFLTEQEKSPSNPEELKETVEIAHDGSQITTMYDRSGNKIETRAFNNHQRIAYIIMRTSAAGEKQVFVYGHSGIIKSLPENLLDKVLKIPADEIARATGIPDSRQTTGTVYTQTNQTPLKPLPSSQFPIQNQTTQQIPIKDNESNTQSNSEETKPPVGENSQTNQNKEQIVSKRSLNEKE
jgi:hypothetical protein